MAALPLGITRYLLYRKLGGLQDRSGRMRTISPKPGLDSRTVQPLASRLIPKNAHRYYTVRCLPSHFRDVKLVYILSANLPPPPSKTTFSRHLALCLCRAAAFFFALSSAIFLSVLPTYVSWTVSSQCLFGHYKLDPLTFCGSKFMNCLVNVLGLSVGGGRSLWTV
jgi:hypothetical protein